METSPKLRRYISIALWALALIMISAYSILAGFTLLIGFEDMAAYDLHLSARDFAEQYRRDSAAELPGSPYLKSYVGGKDLPVWLKDNYASETFVHGKPDP